jgi:hypothetical protein
MIKFQPALKALAGVHSGDPTLRNRDGRGAED